MRRQTWPSEGSHRTYEAPRRKRIRRYQLGLFVGTISAVGAAMLELPPDSGAAAGATAIVTVRTPLTVGPLMPLGDVIFSAPLSRVTC